MKLKTEGKLKIDRKEDGGQSVICESFPFNTMDSDPDTGMFIVVQSYDLDGVHADIQHFLGKKVKITIETIE